jgi:signal transduction histidine kinase
MDIEQGVFRIVQEALANVARHSQANSVEIALVYANDDITLTVTDDGRGFDVDGKRGGIGLPSRVSRARERLSLALYRSVIPEKELRE